MYLVLHGEAFFPQHASSHHYDDRIMTLISMSNLWRSEGVRLLKICLPSGNKIITIKIYTGTMGYYRLKESTKGMIMPIEQTFRQLDAVLQSKVDLALQ